MIDAEDDLPIGWAAANLDDVTEVVKLKIDPADAPDAPYVGLEHIEAHTMRLVGTGSASDVTSAKTRFSSGDVLYGKLRPYLNKVARPDFDGICSTDLVVLTESPQLDLGYVACFLNQLWVAAHAHHISTGVELPRVDWKQLASLTIRYPTSKDAQRAIVRLIDEARSRSAAAWTMLASVRTVVGRLRRAVLVSACSGRLTADWRDEHQCDAFADVVARDYSTVRKVRRGVDATLPAIGFAGLPETWASMTVAQMLTSGVLVDVKDGNHGANHPKVAEFTSDGLPFITANLVRDGEIDYDSASRVDGEVLDRLRVGFSEAGDVVLTHKGSVGRVAMATRDAVLTPQTTYYRCEQAVLEPTYLELFLASLYFYEQLARVMAQTTRDFVPITQQYRLSVALPPVPEQHEIVRRVTAIFDFVRTIEQRIDIAQGDIERISQAVLTKAFRGELPPIVTTT